VSKVFFYCGVDLYRGRGWRDTVASSQQALAGSGSTTTLRIAFAAQLCNYASARLFVANTILLRNLFS
jgi:hypothetical protein